MDARERQRHHILTLVVEKSADIPMIRGKAKLLARSVGYNRRQVTRLATAASELARMLLTCCRGGKMRMSFFRAMEEKTARSLEFVFQSSGPCTLGKLKGSVICHGGRDLFSHQPFRSLERIFDDVVFHGGIGSVPLKLSCRIRLDNVPENEDPLGRIGNIRKKLFSDTEESYMENLRAKHDEVLRLLREKSEQNKMLDQSNTELAQLGNDLEALAQERTIIEMSLKIADQVRNPATVIGGLAKRLLKKEDVSDPVAQKVKQIVIQAEHIDQIVHRFHAMADARRNLFVQEDLLALVREGTQACPTIAKRAITLRFEANGKPVFIHANRRVLKVAFIHLLRHIARVTPTGGEVVFQITRNAETAFVSIFNHGKGFSDEEAQTLQQMASSEMQPEQPGLALVRQILVEHQGKLLVENIKEPGQGRRLVMQFPLVWREQGSL